MAKKKISEIVRNAQERDIFVFAEISRIGRTTLQVLEVPDVCTRKGVDVHIAKQRMILDSLTCLPRRTTTVLGLTAEIARELISARTKEALVRRRRANPWGRPKGKANEPSFKSGVLIQDHALIGLRCSLASSFSRIGKTKILIEPLCGVRQSLFRSRRGALACSPHAPEN
uniref:Resolvase, N terminal domain n=1 Tax=Candidatus Kentrum sp. TUN TaxID=2126343 RepID=A0A450ZHM7_9GAMM|nr:MAG: Resolvase, N terminal domain [Candidatus Kentron sp. TUN]VFK53279.1 MAG: Resolvase, N terminal domain [Candidatus Kentron sp. TUN]VFK60468.1 MAG: Resolvase, N terminal domain [Candidatus Kentron sp. TUN]